MTKAISIQALVEAMKILGTPGKAGEKRWVCISLPPHREVVADGVTLPVGESVEVVFESMWYEVGGFLFFEWCLNVDGNGGVSEGCFW